MHDKDIQNMFKEKNREIIKNNLKLDITRNIDVLIDTITNIFNNNFDLSIKNIISVFEDSMYLDSSKTVTAYMNKLKLDSFNYINKQIEIKRDLLNEKIDSLSFDDDIDDYYDLVFTTTNSIDELFKSDEIYNLKNNTIKEFDKYAEEVLNDLSVAIAKSRINDYINYRLFGKIEEKLKDELKIRDNNLINKGKESYEKFQEISSMTANI